VKLLTIEEVNEPIYYNNWQSWVPLQSVLGGTTVV
jgi:hypothetical protein